LHTVVKDFKLDCYLTLNIYVGYTELAIIFNTSLDQT
jgi:hypothetical protein